MAKEIDRLLGVQLYTVRSLVWNDFPGTLDWRAILRLAARNHVPYMYVEEDQTDKSLLENPQIRFDNLVKFLGKD